MEGALLFRKRWTKVLLLILFPSSFELRLGVWFLHPLPLEVLSQRKGLNGQLF